MEDKIDFFLLSAHELRTSLSAMKWLFKMLNDGDYGQLNAEQQAAIAQATQSNEHMIALLNDTMTAIKDDNIAGYAQLPVNLDTLISGIIKEFGNEAAAKKITLTYHQSSSPVTVLGDESKLCIAFHNVIENAIKYSNAGTAVTISLAGQDKQAVVRVQDRGIGVPQDKMSHLFERFFRAGNNNEDGTGLGLYSSKIIVERHHGSIAMDSTEGAGSTVTVILPLQA